MDISVYVFTFRNGVKYEVFTLHGEPYIVYGRFQALFNLRYTLRTALCEYYSNDRGCVSGDELNVLKQYAKTLHIKRSTPRITIFPLAKVIDLGKEMHPFLEDIGKQFTEEEAVPVEKDVDIDEEEEAEVEEVIIVPRKRERDDDDIKAYIDVKFTEMANHFENVHKKWYSEEHALELRSLAVEKISIEEHKRVYDLENQLTSTQQELDRILTENYQLIEKAKKLSAVSRYIEMINSEIH